MGCCLNLLGGASFTCTGSIATDCLDCAFAMVSVLFTIHFYTGLCVICGDKNFGGDRRACCCPALPTPFLTAFSGAAGSRLLCPGHPRLDWLAQIPVFHLLWLQHAVEGKWCFFALIF